MARFVRYVALGDSTSEGMDDPDGRGGYRGWADRLASRVAASEGGLLYANLAVRGRTTRAIREEQLAPALALRPDLATVVAGTNDVLAGRFEAARFGAELASIQAPLVAAGATVLSFTLPDLAPVMPLARLIGHRVRSMNDAIRAACTETGALLCDLALHPVASDRRLWSEDRLHANTAGHVLIADALAWRLGLPGTDESWTSPLPLCPSRTFGGSCRAEIDWVRRHLAPWVARHLQGRSSGDGRQAKRPRLLPVAVGGDEGA